MGLRLPFSGMHGTVKFYHVLEELGERYRVVLDKNQFADVKPENIVSIDGRRVPEICRIGYPVKMQGLLEKTHLNGRQGKIKEFFTSGPARGRYRVKYNVDQKVLDIKPQFLVGKYQPIDRSNDKMSNYTSGEEIKIYYRERWVLGRYRGPDQSSTPTMPKVEYLGSDAGTIHTVPLERIQPIPVH